MSYFSTVPCFAQVFCGISSLALILSAKADAGDTYLGPLQFEGSDVRIEWNSGGELQFGPTINGPWAAADAETLRQSTARLPASGANLFFRVLNKGIPGPVTPLIAQNPSRPFQIDRAWIRRANSGEGNAVLEAELTPGQNPPPQFPVLQDGEIVALHDDGQNGDATAGDGVFTAAFTVDVGELAAANEFTAALPDEFRVIGNFAGRELISGILPTQVDLDAFNRGDRVQVHPSPFEGRGQVPQGQSVPARARVGRSAALLRPTLIREVCLTNLTLFEVITATNVQVGIPGGMLTNIDCQSVVVGHRERFQTNVVCEDVIVGAHERRVFSNVVCQRVILNPIPGQSEVCVTNVIANPLRLATNVICLRTRVLGDEIAAGECVTNVVLLPEVPEFLTNIVCELVAVRIEPVIREICFTNVFIDPNPLPIFERACVTNIVALEPEPIVEIVCTTNIITLPPIPIFTNILVTNVAFLTNITCTNLMIGGGDTNIIELPLDDVVNRPPIWDHSLLITDLSVVEDPTRTWDPCHPDRGTKMGAWTFGRLMTDICNPAVTGIPPGELARRWLRSWQTDQVINFDKVPDRNAEVLAQVIQDWELASGGPEAPLDLSIAPFRLLAIVNRLDLRANPGYAGGSAGDPCNPACIGGEGRFVFGLVPPRRSTGGGGGYGGSGSDATQDSCGVSQFTVIFEYCVPKDTCSEIKAYALEWYNLALTPFGPAFNAALQHITEQFAAAGADPSRKPNLSALNQLRANELLREPWDMREWRLFANDSDAGWLREVTVKQTPDFDLNLSPRITEYALSHVGAILAEQHVVPLQHARRPFLGGSAPMPTRDFFWDGPLPTGTIPGEVRHRFSLNTCNGCHAGETGTPFTHIFPRAFGQPAALSDFLTGLNMPKLDPADRVTQRFFSDLKRREDDLIRLVKEPCFFQLFKDPVGFVH